MSPAPPTPAARSACEANATSKSRPADQAAASSSPGDTCILCGGSMYGVHCKLICANCGYREDCSDLFPVNPSPNPGAPGVGR